MKTTINFRALTYVLLVALIGSYLLCIVGDLLFGWTMYQAWAPLLPGFTWPLTIGGFLIGVLWLGGYSLYAAALIAFPYDYFVQRENHA